MPTPAAPKPRLQLFYLGINVAVIVAPLVCGALGQKVSWSLGFGAAGVGMLLGLAVYLSGLRWLPRDAGRRPGRAAASERTRLTRDERLTVLLLVGLLVPMALAITGNMEIFNAYLVWGDANYNLVLFGRSLPASWLVSLDALVSTAMLIGSVAFWRVWARLAREPDEIVKLALAAFVAAVAPLILAAASAQVAATHARVGLLWGLAFHLVNDAGIAVIFPVGLALYSRAAPRAVSGLMIGVYFLQFFAANMLVGWLGGRLAAMGGAAFWSLHAGLVAAGAVTLALFAVFFRRRLAPTVDPELQA